MSTPVRRAIYNKLAGDSTLTNLLGNAASGYGTGKQGVYHNAAPDHAIFPFVVFSKSSGVPTAEGFGPLGSLATDPRVETEVWMIKAVDRNTTADSAEAIADRINVLLTDADLRSNGVPTQQYLRRESDVEYSELTEGDLYQHVGALYRLIRTSP